MRPFQARAGLLAVAAAVVCTASGCGMINSIRAKNEINEAARAYKAGKFAEAEQHSRRALELDPNQKNAPLFIARTVHAQYKPGVDNPANVEIARKAIAAYQEILARDPANEEAYKAIAALYGALDQQDKQREFIMQRASMESIPPEQRSEAYTVLAAKDWDCSYKITELPANMVTTKDKDGKPIIVRKKPKDQKDYDTALQCATRGLEEAEKAIGLSPTNDKAWGYKTNLLLERAKLAEMDGKSDQKADYTKQADEAQKRTTELAAQNEQKRKEAEARKSPPRRAG